AYWRECRFAVLQPGVPATKGASPLGLALTAIVLVGVVIDVAGQGLDGLAARLMWRMGVECLAVMTVLSVPPVIALGY
ncbi:hypothetical protein ACO1MG_14060, partial [Staphylococcus aureus]